ncbi:probable disease resistance protein At4g27220 [Olea europaea var. sylvestris]|uniref:probable disease resistance protein At4g27220 n=1 Tax=Olea europaea var. sylvestris TaxID=158386 RepID=UPI000C1D1FFE|nr:probable disease resistance protein At4g27220 [Olea europaea var. sylvestris]XP_022888410.1 probable disease resistance protein At4g27220 [Olea europaea var. sylvestris]
MSDMLTNIVVKAASNYYTLEENMQNLKRKTELLNTQQADVVAMLREAEVHPNKKRKGEVQYWLNNVEKKQEEFESLEQKVNESKFYSRIQLAKRVDKMIEEVVELVDRGTFPEGIVFEVNETIDEQFVTVEWKHQAFEKNIGTVWSWLMSDEVSTIGIYGMGGVGKTTLAQCIYNKLKNETVFHANVFWFTVSQDLNIRKLQNDIAKALNLDLSAKGDEHKRAAKLGKAFKRIERSVFIFDDVWTSFSSQRIGISPSLAIYGFKMIVISRSLEVCRKMECHKYLKVEVLSEEEAWNLFMNKLSYGIRLPPKVEEIAREVVKKCAGLPLAIITMAGSLRGVIDIHEWRDTLEELKESSVGQTDMENEVLPILLCSFNRLRDPKLQRCFLYTSLYPEDYCIQRDELITRFISEDLMERRRSRQADFDQGHTILNKLENVCLLERSTSYHGNEQVKMHDLIRDMALSITKDKPRYMVKAGLQLKKIPEAQEWREDLDKISLMHNNIAEISSGTSPKCPRLSTLLLCFNPLKSVPDLFFEQMHSLHVLDLCYTNIEYLPSSISDLKELNALLLRYCFKLMLVPPLGNLKALRELDISKTGVKEIPQGMESLTNLKRLDTFDSCIENIPTGILQGLPLLQRLTLPKCIIVPIEEVEGLKQLEEFQGKLSSMCDFNRFIKSQLNAGRLSFYDIQIGDGRGNRCYYPERLACKLVAFGKDSLKKGQGLCQDEIMVPQDIEELFFRQCGLSRCLLDDFQKLNNSLELKQCHVEKEDGTECIVRLSSLKELMEEVEEHSLSIPLQSLQILHLLNLPNFIGLVKSEEGVAAAPLPHGAFSQLQKLEILHCGKMKKLLHQSYVNNLHNLRVLKVESCVEMEEIIGDNDEGGLVSNRSADVTLPRLKSLMLQSMPKLKSICRGTVICDSIEYIGLFLSKSLKKMPLFLPNLDGQPSHPPFLKSIHIFKEEKEWWESLEWNHSNAKDVLQPFVEYL